jgi:hypothetical protein
MAAIGIIGLIVSMLAPASTRDFNFPANDGPSLRIQIRPSHSYAGEPLRFTDETGQKVCYDPSGTLTVQCVNQFYGSAIAVSLKFGRDGEVSDTLTTVSSHPKVMPLPPETRVIDSNMGRVDIYRVYGYDEKGISANDVMRFRQIQAPYWIEVREDVNFNDRPVVSFYWKQTLGEIQLERIERH